MQPLLSAGEQQMCSPNTVEGTKGTPGYAGLTNWTLLAHSSLSFQQAADLQPGSQGKGTAQQCQCGTRQEERGTCEHKPSLLPEEGPMGLGSVGI